MTENEWQAWMTRRAAMEIGRWLEGRGRLHQPIAALTVAELEAMAASAISRFVLDAATRARERPDADPDLTRLLLG